MMGMEKMLANMLGITPEEMTQSITDFQNLAKDLKVRLEIIELKQDQILTSLSERQVNGGRTKRSNGNIGNDTAQ